MDVKFKKAIMMVDVSSKWVEDKEYQTVLTIVPLYVDIIMSLL